VNELLIHSLREHPPLEPTIILFVFDGEPAGWPWGSGVGGAVFYRMTEGTTRPYSWGEVVDQHIDWALDPDLDDTMPQGWVRLVPEAKEAS
jgi:hypothetical protein